MSVNKKIIISVLLTLLVITGLLFFDSLAPLNHTDAVYVGVLMPFSKDFSWWGDAIRNSIHVAQSQGYTSRVIYVYEDTQCNSKDAVSATRSLKIRYPSMHLFIVGCDSDLKAMTPILDASKDLAFMVGLSGADLYSSSFPIINLAYRLEDEASVMASFASQYLGVKKMGMIVDNGTFGDVLSSTSAAYMTSRGGSVVVETLKYNHPNPETSVLKIVSAHPDAVYIQNDIPTIVAILKRLDQFGYRGKRLVYYGGRDQSLIDGAGISAEGVYMPWAISSSSSPLQKKFTDAYTSMYRKEPFITAYFVYDGVMVLHAALQKCSTDIRCVETYFYSTEHPVGTLGVVRYRTGGEVDRQFYVEQVKNGSFVEVVK